MTFATTFLRKYTGRYSGTLKSSTLLTPKRSLSSQIPHLVTVQNDDENGIAILSMNRPPANSLSLEMMQAFSNSIAEAEAHPHTKGLILHSNLQKIFSAGLDLSELYQPDSDRLPLFWAAFQQLYLDLYGSRLATFAAIQGHAPAAGCMLALSCDYRVMTDEIPAKIGLNESQLGIVAPPWLAQMFIDTVGQRQAELALSLGTLYTPSEALNVGLVDEVVTSDVLDVASEKAKEWIQIQPAALLGVKDITRKSQLDTLRENRESDSDAFCSFVTEEEVQRALGNYLELLAKRKS